MSPARKRKQQTHAVIRSKELTSHETTEVLKKLVLLVMLVLVLGQRDKGIVYIVPRFVLVCQAGGNK